MLQVGQVVRLTPKFCSRVYIPINEPEAIVETVDSNTMFGLAVTLHNHKWVSPNNPNGQYFGILNLDEDVDLRQPVNETISKILETLEFVEFTGATRDGRTVTIK